MGRLKKVWRNFRRYRKWVGLTDALAFSIFSLTGNETLRHVEIAGHRLYARTATSDLDVAAETLILGEYDGIRCHSPSIIVDAGANIGTSSIYFATKFPAARVFAIEPERSNFDILTKNIAPFSNIVAINAAIWGDSGEKIIKNRFTGPWGYTIAETANETESTGQLIRCITMLEFMEEFGCERIDLLKMDIEGGEKNVLENAEPWIGRINIVTAELHDRICMGCDRAFYLATRDFVTFEKNGEKVTAYRE